MRNLFLLLGCFVASLMMQSCTVESIEKENPVIVADEIPNPSTPVIVPPVSDHGGGDKDKGDF